MKAASRDFVTVDMRGLKAALGAHARVRRTSTSELVRAAVSEFLARAGVSLEDERANQSSTAPDERSQVKLSIRLTAEEAALLSSGARFAGRSRGAYLADLAAGIRDVGSPELRREIGAALVRSCAEMSTLSRDLRHLVTLLKSGAMRAAHEYRPRLEGVESDVRRHLDLAASALAHVPSWRRPQTPVTSGTSND